MKFKEELFKRRRIYSGNAVGFSADKIILPDGKMALREYMEHPGAVAVIAFVDKERIAMVRQYRYPVKEMTLELPAGKIDRGESLLSCVRRELQEETGFYARKIKKIFSFWPTCAFSNEVIHIYHAVDLKKTSKSPDHDEFLKSEVVRFRDAVELVKKGRIRDSKTMIGILFWESFRRRV